MMTEANALSFFEKLCTYGCHHCLEHAGGGIVVEMVLVTMKGNVLGRARVGE